MIRKHERQSRGAARCASSGSIYTGGGAASASALLRMCAARGDRRAHISQTLFSVLSQTTIRSLHKHSRCYYVFLATMEQPYRSTATGLGRFQRTGLIDPELDPASPSQPAELRRHGPSQM